MPQKSKYSEVKALAETQQPVTGGNGWRGGGN